jgi:hypothetical protein
LRGSWEDKDAAAFQIHEGEWTMTPIGRGLNYERTLRALGRVAEKKGLRNICLLELDGGVILQGQSVRSTREGYVLVMETSVFKRDELESLMRELGF